MAPEVVLVAFTRSADCRKGPGLSIMSFVTKGYNPNGTVQFEREATAENIEAEIAKGDFKILSWRIVDPTELPDRTFRDAWTDNKNHIGHDMSACRNIHRARLRKQRAPLLAALDVQYQQADERGNGREKSLIAKKKQALRDITADPRIESAATPEELLKVTL